ncbi:Uma2 family endonuclease [Crocosphaera sp. XPORK-15E]|uniref:Uma2 family endonuclease n=1 Tax=Crocosphaera sp. XPORK-15E TaxID=3110247 RepID=UPI002B1F2734|nr:Uma2 family endonuclease [Crocosphaera sp. XPORK-15E]MEA5536437.1 Uma2 family endonuclease [Crocosphaera sp. XPORK-15E]
MDTLIKWSVEDYHKMIEAGILSDRSCELIAGEILQMSPEGTFHRYINHSVADYLRSILGAQAVISEAHPITLTDSEPEPDIAVVRSPYTLYLNHHPYAEDIYWLIEVSDSTLAKDLGVKKNIYAQAKIREYWVIDLPSKILKVFQSPQDKDYQIKQDYTKGIISPVAFPNLEISVNKLLG